MAKYRQIHTSFWQDGFVLDLTPEEKYFYIYLMTNSKTSQCGIYELPKRVIEIETGYNNETILKLLQRFVDYKKIDYFEGTKEIMILNWIKYNPIANINTLKCVISELDKVKYREFANSYISTLPTDLKSDTEGLVMDLQGAYKGLGSNRIKSKEERVINKEEEIKKSATPKLKYAENVSMTEEEYLKLIEQHGENLIKEKIIDLNLWKGSKGRKTKSDYMTILNWIRRDAKEGLGGNSKQNNGTNSANDYDFSKYTG